MGKYITKFETQTLFDEAKSNLDKPHVSLTVDNNTVHYLGGGVVRPLTRLSSVDEIADYIENYPVDAEGYKDVIMSLEYESGSCVPVLFEWHDGELSIYALDCDDAGHLVNSSGVENEVYLSELPCYTVAQQLNSILTPLLAKVADKGEWNSDKTGEYSRDDYNNKLIRVYYNIEDA